MEEYYYKRSHVPKFGSWDWNDHNNFPYTNCFDSVTQPGSLRYSYSAESEDRDLYGTADFYDNHVVSSTMLLNVPRKRAKVTDKHEKEIKKKNWVSKMDIELKPNPQPNLIPTSLPIEEDLYNISPHLPYAKVKKRRGLCFFSTCFLPACIA
ncbi:hypothetical protein MtrunA17_Chr7g0234391 [Medicago truncatula]|uniref:Pathogenic type III effector avirulence factor Avr AvrRpt-cleavage: cleavage site protein n=1 Tax=Medicago truncatula TaxID=3880 RepID=G7KZ17_MEDTR|nr:uncharacterized protein LOC11435618 [Medicago truncatula]AES79021.1 pathogenic type III effector avirulence factor Avr AvrRpt-cleavage: cleavage site protein [Medicago truncatula]RHN45718.1 hypothetical protein MtrunA17_Chr7g0234391 [Medicago truncatula]